MNKHQQHQSHHPSISRPVDKIPKVRQSLSVPSLYIAIGSPSANPMVSAVGFNLVSLQFLLNASLPKSLPKSYYNPSVILIQPGRFCSSNGPILSSQAWAKPRDGLGMRLCSCHHLNIAKKMTGFLGQHL